MSKTDKAVEQLIEVVKQALQEGRASSSDLEEWLLAAILLEEMSLEEEHDRRDAGAYASWRGVLH